MLGKGERGPECSCHRGPGRPGRDGVLAQYTGPNPAPPRGKIRAVRSDASPEGTLRAPRRPGSSWTSAPSSWSVASIWPRRIVLDRAGRRRRAPGRDALVGGHPQHAQHVRPIRHEDRVGQPVRSRRTAPTARIDSSVVRLAVLPQDRVGRHAVGDRVGAGGGGLGRPVALGLAAGHDQVRRDAGMEERDGVVQPRREDRRWPAVVLGRAHHHDRVGRRCSSRCPAPRSGTSRSRRRRRRRRSRRRPPRPGRAPSSVASSGSVWAGGGAGRSAPVALLVLRARPAPARVVAPDPRAARGEAGLRARSPRPPPPGRAGASPAGRPATRRIGRAVGGAAGPPRRMAEPPTAAAAGTRAARPTPGRTRRRSSRSTLRAVRAAAAAQRGGALGQRGRDGRIATVGRAAGWRVTVTRKIVDATPWRIRPRSSSYSANASRLNSLSGSCWA